MRVTKGNFRKEMKFMAALLSITLAALSAEGAVVYLKDGSRLQGTVVSATARDIELHTANGTMRINTDRIDRIDYGESETSSEFSEPSPPSRRVPRRYRRSARPPTSLRLDTRQMFSFDLGFAVPLSEVDFSSTGGGKSDNGDTGILIGGQYLYYVTPRLGTGLNFEFFNRSTSNSRSLLPNADTRISGNTLMLLAVARYTIVNRGAARPYLMAGVGTNRTSTAIEAQPLIGFAWSDTGTDETRTLVDDSDWGFASTVRFGIDFWAHAPASFNLEIGWTGISNGRYEANPFGKDVGLSSVTGSLDVLNVAARWGWRF